MLGSTNVKEMAEFYTKLLGNPAFEQDGWYGWNAGDTMISLGEHSEAPGKSKEPARMILNFDAEDVKAEFDKVKAMGVTVIKEPYDAGEGHMVCTFTDPDGNYIQFNTPWKM